MKIQDIHMLIDKSLSGSASREEQRLVDQWYDGFDEIEGMEEPDLEYRMQQQLDRIRKILEKKEPRIFLVIV